MTQPSWRELLRGFVSSKLVNLPTNENVVDVLVRAKLVEDMSGKISPEQMEMFIEEVQKIDPEIAEQIRLNIADNKSL